MEKSPKKKLELLKTKLYLQTPENSPSHDKKKIDQSRCLLLLNNHSHTMTVFMINYVKDVASV